MTQSQKEVVRSKTTKTPCAYTIVLFIVEHIFDGWKEGWRGEGIITVDDN